MMPRSRREHTQYGWLSRSNGGTQNAPAADAAIAEGRRKRPFGMEAMRE
jgi:hypothetical protein